MTSKRNWFRAGLVALVLAGTLASASTSQAADPRADYIVTFKSSVTNAKGVAAIKAVGGSPFFVYQHAINGAAVSLPASAVAKLRGRAEIASIELDGPVQATAEQLNPPSWGLDRIDQVSGTNGSYVYDHTGAGVTAYIIDTGILETHQEFGKRVRKGFSAFKDRRGSTDCNGHGTHVAGTVGGSSVGVAKAVNLVAVRVLDCRGSGTWSGVIAGIDWATNDHTNAPAVANLSLGGGFSASVNAAVARLVADGVVVAVAAGNENSNACNTSPASEPTALTVGATDSSDVRASFSNYGSCLDLFAPGVAIYSSIHSSTSAYATYSGTSMASPHVAGVAALIWSSKLAGTASDVSSALVAKATSGTVSDLQGSFNRLLYSRVSLAVA